MDWNEIWRQIEARIERATGRLRFAVRAVVLAADPSTALPQLNIEALANERLPAELFQHYGFKSVPPTSAEAIAVQVGGRGGHYVVIATGDRSTAPSGLVSGDSCIYAATGARVTAKADGTIEISTPSGGTISMDASGKINLNAGTKGVARVGDSVTITGTCTVNPGTHSGTITATGIIAAGSATVKAGG